MKDSNSPEKSWRKYKKLNLKPLNKRAKRIEKKSLKHAHKYLVGRWENLRYIRRHVMGWLFLIALLCGLTLIQIFLNYRSVSHSAQVKGGVYAEGSVDSINTLNPLFASTQSEIAATKLIYSGLLRYDEQGELQGDLAHSMNIEERGKKYTLSLRSDIYWHDGKPVSADDVVFTVKTLQDPKVGAVTFQSWRGIEVVKKSDKVVEFTLPNAYAPFASQLTTALIPQHILASVDPTSLQENEFNRDPVGAGPYKMIDLKSLDPNGQKSLLQLQANESYWGGEPNIARLSLATYENENKLVSAFKTHEINAANDITTKTMKEMTPQDTDDQAHNVPINSGVYALFKTNSPLLQTKEVRQALVVATDTAKISQELLGKPLYGPLTHAFLPESTKLSQEGYDIKVANNLLESNGWKKVGLFREKGGVKLELRVVSVDTDDYRKVIDLLKKQWEEVGVRVIPQYVDPEQIQQSILKPREFDVLVYELEFGGDPDVYAYWHSSQANENGANFSNYTSPLSDDALIAGRVRSDMVIRDQRYSSFVKQWITDAPAVALYQPTLHYLIAPHVKSIDETNSLPTVPDRFNAVGGWSVNTDSVYNTP